MVAPQKELVSGPALVLDVKGVGVSASGTQILNDVYLKLFGGELCALVGPSGAGKSTLIKVLLGIRSPQQGQVSLAGEAIPGKRAVGYVPQDDALHNTLSVEKELHYAAELRLGALSSHARQEKLQEVIEAVGLEERLDLPIAKLSGGQRKRVSVAVELLTEPDLLILDEPTSGLDPGLERRMMNLFADVASEGRVVLVATHAMESVERCNALCVLVRGQIAFFGKPSDALSFFRTESYAGLFAQLDKQLPTAWSRAHRSFPPCQEFSGRTAPARLKRGIGKSSPSSNAEEKQRETKENSAPTTSSPVQKRTVQGKNNEASASLAQQKPTPVQESPEDALSALKKKMGAL
ncbi:MAG: ABC transporter ATP-binding protein [Deltaproteobacteria bacterium]|nr:ABC transporter ATP-binding protein [Deltaproteobacteria bacterium]